MSHFLRAALSCAVVGACSILFSGQARAAVDPTNMGKGDWIYVVSQAQTAVGAANLQGLIDYQVSKGMKYLIVKAGHGPVWWSQFNTDLITRCHAAGLQIFGYGRCFGDDVTGEINIGKQVLALGADGFIINAEIEYEGKNAQATQMMNGLRATYPDAFIAHAPFVYIDYHTAFPYVEFGKQCDAVMPQCYWRAAGINITPAQMAIDLNTQWAKWHTTWRSQGNGDVVKPIIPIADGYNVFPGSEITTFVNALKNDTNPATPVGRYKGVNFFSCQSHTTSHWSAIGSVSIGDSNTSTPDIIVDNSSVFFAASSNWSTATSAADKYGSDYRFRSTAAVSDAAVWNAHIPKNGNWKVYAWWSQGTNRSATAPYVIPGNTTVPTNQKTNGGKWNQLGTVSISAGTTPVKLSCWTTTGFVVLADAIKFSLQ